MSCPDDILGRHNVPALSELLATLPGVPRIGLLPTSPPCCDRTAVMVFHPHSVRGASWRSVAKHRDLHRIRVRRRTVPQHTQNPSNDHQHQRASDHTTKPAARHLPRPATHPDVAPHTPHGKAYSGITESSGTES
jgi:hypothetical protein